MESQNQTRVVFDNAIISVIREDVPPETVKWDDLDAVIVMTTDSGPFTEDIFYVLVGEGAKTGCVVPQSAYGSGDLLAAMQARLTGFDNEQVVEAMLSTENNTFLIWKKPEQE